MITLPCEWQRYTAAPCGAPATWSVTTHDFNSPDPNAVRIWLMCPDCTLALLKWAQREDEQEAGTFCRGCDALISPTLGAFIIAHAELARPDEDTRYD